MASVGKIRFNSEVAMAAMKRLQNGVIKMDKEEVAMMVGALYPYNSVKFWRDQW